MSPTSTFDPTDPRSLVRRAETYALAFEIAGQALADQERALAELRNRAATLVATAAVAMSLFGGPASGRLHAGPAVYVAVAAFAGVVLCGLWALWPRPATAVTDARALIATYAEPRQVPVALLHREMALRRAQELARSRGAVEQVTHLSRVALLLLATEVIAWVVSHVQTF